MSITHDILPAGRVRKSQLQDLAHVFSGGALGSLLYRDTGASDGASWLAAGAGVLTCAGAGQVPVWSDTFRHIANTNTATFMLDSGDSFIIGDGGHFITTSAPNPIDDLTFENNGSVNGRYNTFIGMSAGLSNTSGNLNVFVGNEAGRNNTVGDQNTFVGAPAGQHNTSGFHNTFIGTGTGEANTTGSYNSFVGCDSGLGNISGVRNSFFGVSAGGRNSTGNNNSCLGYSAGYANLTGHGNTAIGTLALNANTTGGYNTAIGYGALYDLDITADDNSGHNVAIGYNTGRGIVTGTGNTIIGSYVTGLAAALTNNIILADGNGSQRINVNSSGFVGIGATDPQAKLHVVKGDGAWGGLAAGDGLLITGATVSKRMVLSYDTVGNYGIIQAGEVLNDYMPLRLNPSGGGVLIGTALISFGANDSAGAGYRLVRVPNV